MTSIRDIDVNDLKLFLRVNDINLNNNEEIYEKAMGLMKSRRTKYAGVPDSIIEWMMAHNLIKLNTKIPAYTKNQIKNMMEEERRELADLLGMKTSNVDKIINILNYMHKLIILSELPEDPILDIISNMNINDIMNFCNSDKTINKICQSKNLKNTIISKLSKNHVDVSKFTLDELFLYSKVLNLRKRINIFDTKIYVFIDNTVYKPYDGTSEFDGEQLPNNINQIAPYGYYGFDLALLSDDDQILSMYMHRPKEIDKFFNNDIGIDKIIDIKPILSGTKSLELLTADGKFYRWDSYDGLKSEEAPVGTIQREGVYYLTYTGDVYHRKYSKINKIEGLSNIKQITHNGFFLSENGDVYVFDNDDIILHPGVKNITQICSRYRSRNNNKYQVYMLDNKGYVYFKAVNIDEIDLIIPKLYEGLKDIVEIEDSDIIGFAALDKYNRLSLKNRDSAIQLYQWHFK